MGTCKAFETDTVGTISSDDDDDDDSDFDNDGLPINQRQDGIERTQSR